MSINNKQKHAREIINDFICELKEIDGMNDQVAEVIQVLWKNGNLRRDELLSELKKLRDEDSADE
jgi:hypothetical protein